VSKLVQIRVAADLVTAACRGDAHAQSEIYAVVAAATFALVRRLVGRGAQAEDLFQDTMMAFYEHLPSYRAAAPIGAWLRQIAVSKCLMYLRSPWHRARLQLDAGWQENSSRAEFNLPIQPAPAAESLDVERALASLSPTARAVVWLYEVEGYSHHEIGRAFGRTASFSKSQLARAHYRLRAWFEPCAESPACTST
jgi:RNA polymerase sigma-70 factor (ECF subfamily)